MYKSITTSLVNASRVAELLIERYSPKAIEQIVRISENVFLVRLRSGGMAQAVVRTDGSLYVQELEEAQ